MRPGSRLELPAALATWLGALALTSLVTGLGWLVEATVIVAAVALAGAATRRVSRHPAVAVAAQLVAVLVVLTWLYARSEAVLGLVPGLRSTTRLLELGALGLQVCQEVAAPAPGQPGVRLLAVGGVAALAVLVDLLAVGLRQPAVAGLPLLAAYCVPSALARGGLAWYWFAFAAAGYLLLIAADSGDRVARWGRVLRGEGGQAAPLAATGRRVGALALVTAVVVPSLVPGLSENLFLGRGAGNGQGSGSQIHVVNPIFNLRDNLTANQDSPVLTYTTTGTPQPLRIVTVDTFDGTTWQPTLGTVPRTNAAAGALPPPPGLGPDVTASPERYRIRIENLNQAWLPVPYPPTRIDILGPWLYDDRLNVLGDDVTTKPGLSYDVRYLDLTPTPEQLLDAPPAPPEVLAQWTTLPKDVPEVVSRTARQVAGEGTPYEQAVRLQSFFRFEGGFQYSVRAPEPRSPSALADFLQRRSGYCVHFASAMAVMARSLGIPARVAVGFLPGARNPDESYTVTLRDAHAWPELYFAGVGWVRFEPTPQTRSGVLPSWAAPPVDLPGAELPSAEPSAAAAPVEAQDRGAASAGSAATQPRGLGELLAAVPWRLVAGGAVVLMLAAAPAVAARLVRRHRWRRAGRGQEVAAMAEAAWANLVEQVRDLGVTLPGSATPRQTEDRVAAGLRTRDRAALHRVARAVEQARYAPRPVEPVDLRGDVRRVVSAVAAGTPRRLRWRAWLLPASGADHLRDAVVDCGLWLDGVERRLARRLRALSASGRRAGGPSAPRGAA
jgi:transglutaminase-like putative cysteine protease